MARIEFEGGNSVMRAGMGIDLPEPQPVPNRRRSGKTPALTVEEAKKIYLKVYPDAIKWKWLGAVVNDDTGDMAVCPKDEQRVYRGRWLMFRADGTVEKGILWGGDVWEPAGRVDVGSLA